MVAAYWRALRLFSRDVHFYLITAALIGFTVFGGIYAVLLNLYLLRLGYGPPFVGLSMRLACWPSPRLACLRVRSADGGAAAT